VQGRLWRRHYGEGGWFEFCLGELKRKKEEEKVRKVEGRKKKNKMKILTWLLYCN
jgi:hypothetical protein